MKADVRARIAAEAITAHEAGPPALVATVIATRDDGAALLGAKMLVRPDGSVLGSLDGGALDDVVREEAPEMFRRHGAETMFVTRDGRKVTRQQASERQAYTVMLEVLEPAPRLLIIGGGHIGKALAIIGDLCGFSIEVIDDRPEYANVERFPEADRITRGRFDEVLADYPIDSATCVVCVTRGHKHDETSLRLVAASPAAYVGMIGSRRRVAAVLQHLLEEGVPREAIERVRTPIGLDIGAETPEEIAVAIMAEIIMLRRGGSGEAMREANKARRGVAPPERRPPGETAGG